MKAITIKQPRASLIVEGVINSINKSWKCPDKYIGKRVFIHAGGRPENLKIGRESLISVDKINMMSALGRAEDENLFGCIIGFATIEECFPLHQDIWVERSLYAQDDQTNEFFNPYKWIFSNPIKLTIPIPCKGKPRLWDPDKNPECISFFELHKMEVEELRLRIMKILSEVSTGTALQLIKLTPHNHGKTMRP